MEVIEEKVWQEKYRPIHVAEVISIHTEKILKQLENPKSIQNFLFHSRIGGTGKTSMAKAIIKDLGCDFKALNASKDRSIDTIRTTINDFCCSTSSNSNLKKCVWMDEGEKLTKDAMDALKNMIETYSSNAFFIFTTNNINKINQPMQSRFNVMEFGRPEKTTIGLYLHNICIKENMKYDSDAIDKLRDIHYPSIRCMVNHLQDLKLDNKDVIRENITSASKEFDLLWELIKQKKYNDVRTTIIKDSYDVLLFNKYIFEKIIDDTIPFGISAKIIKIVARNERDFGLGADKTITFVASLPEIMAVF